MRIVMKIPVAVIHLAIYKPDDHSLWFISILSEVRDPYTSAELEIHQF